MNTKHFQNGNYIYECKSSPSKLGSYFDTSYLKQSIKKLRTLWISDSTPSGYRYVFPVNYIDDNAKAAIDTLQEEHPNVDIRYYECDDVQNLIFSLDKVGNLPELVEYLKHVRGM